MLVQEPSQGGLRLTGLEEREDLSRLPCFLPSSKKPGKRSRVYVIETKGPRLKNEDTSRKTSVSELSNRLGKKMNLEALLLRFLVVFEDECKDVINHIFSS